MSRISLASAREIRGLLENITPLVQVSLWSPKQTIIITMFLLVFYFHSYKPSWQVIDFKIRSTTVHFSGSKSCLNAAVVWIEAYLIFRDDFRFFENFLLKISQLPLTIDNLIMLRYTEGAQGSPRFVWRPICGYFAQFSYFSKNEKIEKFKISFFKKLCSRGEKRRSWAALAWCGRSLRALA